MKQTTKLLIEQRGVFQEEISEIQNFMTFSTYVKFQDFSCPD